MGKITSYQSVIRGNYLTVFRAEFPLWEIIKPPDGWSFLKVSEWRPRCPDQCWRIIYSRTQEPTP